MYKLIIVDDEAAIRRGMCSYIPWIDMGFEVVADFEDGKETIEYLETHEVDVIITDIEMAEVSGLQLIRHVKENGIKTKMVILSGYKLFEYARKALEYKVEYYLLKPLQMDKVKEVFEEIKKNLDEQVTQQQYALMGQEKFNSFLKELQEQFLISILVGGTRGKEDIINKCDFLGLKLKVDRPYAVLDLKMGNDDNLQISFFKHQDNKHKLLKDMFGYDNEAIEYHIVDISYKIIKIIAVSVKDITVDAFKVILANQLEEKCQTTNQLFELNVDISVDGYYKDLSDLLNYNYFSSTIEKKNNRPYDKDNVKPKLMIDTYKKAVKIINAGQFVELRDFVERMFFDLRKLELENMQQLIVDMFSMFSSKLMKMDEGLWSQMVVKINYQSIMDSHDEASLKTLSLDYIDHINVLIEATQSEVSKKVIKESMAYIIAHYSEDISLELMAERCYLNSAYFSRLFKQYAGATFTDYLMDIRMQEAIKFIETGKYKVYEISKKVGYKSEKYFFRVFKQYTGNSPADYYRNMVLKNEQS